MPLGVQLIARRGGDARLLRTAHWLVETLRGAPGRRGRTRRAAAGSGRHEERNPAR
jgi:Asp-tRNA(Asn)/Glu-tRNA(Gln) amidotransferase A subunit family amidase